jgi:hypothetical protein
MEKHGRRAAVLLDAVGTRVQMDVEPLFASRRSIARQAVVQFNWPENVNQGQEKMAQGIVNWLACMGMLVFVFIELIRVF